MIRSPNVVHVMTREDRLRKRDIVPRVVFPCSGFPYARVQRWAHLYEHTAHVGFCTRAKQKERRSTRSERSQESGVERVGWRSLSGWVADARRGRGVKGRRVYIGRSSSGWTAVGENRDSRIEKGRRYRGEEESCEGRTGGGRGGGVRGTEQRVRETVEVGVKSPTRN